MCQLVAADLGKRFGRRILFRRLSFTLEGGVILALTGANGSGKSTLIRILAGVLRPTKGTVMLRADGLAVEDAERPLHVGLVAPYLNVYDGFSARENLAFLAQARRLPEGKDRIDRVLEQVSLSTRADDPVATYSSGMKQRVRIAAALLSDPPLLLFDEPTSNLDAPGVAMVEQVVHGYRKAGRLVIIATNDAREAAACDRVLRVEDFL